MPAAAARLSDLRQRHRRIGHDPVGLQSRRLPLPALRVCGLVFVANPSEDFASLYDAAYYRGDGADSFVNYTEEMGNPSTIRAYEWRGITRAVESLCDTPTVRWLDFGCGLGGLVRYARAHGFPDVYGYDQGWGADWAREHGIEILDDRHCASRRGRSTW